MIYRYILFLLTIGLTSGSFVQGMRVEGKEERAWRNIKNQAAAAGIRNRKDLWEIINNAFLPVRLDYLTKIESYSSAPDKVERLDQDKFRLYDDKLNVTIQCQRNNNELAECWSYKGKVCAGFPRYFSTRESSQMIRALADVYRMQHNVTNNHTLHEIGQDKDSFKCWNDIRIVAAAAGVTDKYMITAVIGDALRPIQRDYLERMEAYLSARNNIEKLDQNKFRLYDDKLNETIECQGDNNGIEKCYSYRGEFRPEVLEYFSDKESSQMIRALEGAHEMQQNIKKFLIDEKAYVVHRINRNEEDECESFHVRISKEEEWMPNNWIHCSQKTQLNPRVKNKASCKDSLLHEKSFDQYQYFSAVDRDRLLWSALFHVLRREAKQQEAKEFEVQ